VELQCSPGKEPLQPLAKLGLEHLAQRHHGKEELGIDALPTATLDLFDAPRFETRVA
jgi:hypothetical protein